SILTQCCGKANELASVLANIAHMYYDVELYEKSKEYLIRARSVLEANENHHNLKKNQFSLARVAIAQGRFAEAEMLLEGVRDYFESRNQEKFLAIIDELIGKAHLGNQSPEASIQFFLSSYDLREKTADTLEMINNLIWLGKAYLAMDQPHKGESYLKKAIDFSTKAKSLSRQVDAHYELAETYRAQNDLSNAYSYLNEYTRLKDSLSQIRNLEDLHKAEAQYENRKKQSEIEVLQLENQLSKTELEKKNALQTRLVISLLLLLMALAFVWYWLQNKRKLAEIRFQRKMEQKSELIDGLQVQLDNLLTTQQAASNGKLISMEELNQLIQHPLSEREYDVLTAVAEGKTNQQTSEKLFISLNTVKFHLKNIYNKLDVSNRVQALNMVKKS
ncbi:MAG: tetratricopeptide repeat protein, partial [Flavobacteriales bacterium]|nr:tetratricopeptide repeat protein [Flavobacteriales bacterium]